MPLLFTGAMWSLVGQGRLRLSKGDDGAVTADQIEISEEAKQQMFDDRVAGLRPDSYDSDVMLGFSQRLRDDKKAAGRPPTVAELAGWGRIHERNGVAGYRLAPHDELAHREVLRTPDDWAVSGVGGAWKKFKRRAKSHDHEPKPRADKWELDEANLADIGTTVDQTVGEFRARQSNEADLAAAVLGSCPSAIVSPSPYEGVRLQAT